jgi:hypothetical protein
MEFEARRPSPRALSHKRRELVARGDVVGACGRGRVGVGGHGRGLIRGGRSPSYRIECALASGEVVDGVGDAGDFAPHFLQEFFALLFLLGGVVVAGVALLLLLLLAVIGVCAVGFGGLLDLEAFDGDALGFEDVFELVQAVA